MRTSIRVSAVVIGVGFCLAFLLPAQAWAIDQYTFYFFNIHRAEGSWFGRAVPIGPCTPGTAGCPLPPELYMVLNVFDKGNFIGHDSLTFGAQHTTAHGQWVPLSRQQITANYVVLAGSSATADVKGNGTIPVASPFLGVFRMRWLANLVTDNSMEGFVNVWFFPFNDPVSGISNIDPATWIPKPDPLVDLGPFITDQNMSLCDPTKGCLGIFKFKIRRVSAN
jgi:hypothetical protein